MPSLPALFNHNSADDLAVPWTFNGQRGWYKVPTQWALWTDEVGQVWTSPNSDHSAPTYACKLNNDGTMVFQDLLRSRIDGN